MDLDSKHWELWDWGEDGQAHYAEITADTDVQQIMMKAQGNLAAEGYWRDVATDLASLVDKLKKQILELESAFESSMELQKRLP